MKTSSFTWHRVPPQPLHLRPRPAGGSHWPVPHTAQTRGAEGVLELSVWVCSPASSSEGPASMPPWGTEASPTLSCLLFCMLFSKISNGVFFQQHRWRALSPDTQCRARLCPVLQELALHRDAPSLPAVVAQSLLPGLCPATQPCSAWASTRPTCPATLAAFLGESVMCSKHQWGLRASVRSPAATVGPRV